MNLGGKLSKFRRGFQETLPALWEESGLLFGISCFLFRRPIFSSSGTLGARFLLAETTWDIPTTPHLIDRFRVDPSCATRSSWRYSWQGGVMSRSLPSRLCMRRWQSICLAQSAHSVRHHDTQPTMENPCLFGGGRQNTGGTDSNAPFL